MSKLILITGGARSGKSNFAEEKAKAFGEKVIYVATALPIDDEMQQRIAKHREQRPTGWETIEKYKDIDVVLADKINTADAVLLDCITVMTTNLMFEECSDWDAIDRKRAISIEQSISKQIEKLIELSKSTEVPIILVTNEVGLGLVPPTPTGRMFRDIAGRMNQLLAKVADEVYFCVSGIPMMIKKT